MISSAIELLVREGASFLVVDLVDSILDSLPMLLSLRSLHVGITHLVAVDKELVCLQILHLKFRILIIIKLF